MLLLYNIFNVELNLPITTLVGKKNLRLSEKFCLLSDFSMVKVGNAASQCLQIPSIPGASLFLLIDINKGFLRSSVLIFSFITHQAFHIIN